MAGPKDSGKLLVNLNSFVGGDSIDFKNGVANGFFKSEALDFRSKASQMSVMAGATSLSTSNVLTDLPVEMVQDPNGVRWILGDTGKLYRLDTSDVLTVAATLTDGCGYGMVYNQLSDFLYITGKQTVSLYGPLTTGTPALKDQLFAKSASSANGVVNVFQTTTNNYDGPARNNLLSIATTQGVPNLTGISTQSTTYWSVPNTIDETNPLNRTSFAPDLEPFYSIAVYLKTKGTGDLTLTLHNGFNQSLASITIPNANLTAGQYNEFVFPSPGIRSFTGAIQSGLSAAYHFHLTSSVANDTNMQAGSLTLADARTIDFVLFNYRLVKTNNGMHPATLFTGNGFLLCIGNGQYLATYNFANDQNPSNYVFQREKFPLDAGYEVTSLSQNNQYLVIAAEKRSNNTNRNYQEGALYFWDGQNPTYNFKIQLPMGAPYAINTINNVTYFICSGALYAWGGGQQVIKVRPIAYQNTEFLGSVDSTFVNPNMLATRFNLLMIGYPTVTTNPTIKFGVYNWGSVELVYPNSFGYGYAMSNGTYYSTGVSGNNLQMGMVKNFVDTLYISSRQTMNGTTTYSLDVVNNTSQAAKNFSWDSLIFDGGVRYKQKALTRIKISFLPWPANATLTMYYAFERGAKVTSEGGVSYSPKAGDTSLIVEVGNKRFYEMQAGFTGTCNNPATPPTITGFAMEIDPLQSESDLRVDDQREGS